MKLTPKELAMVLAALRMAQKSTELGGINAMPQMQDIETEATPEDIDALCEALNFAAEPTNEQREELAEAALNAYGDAHPDYKDTVIIFSTLVVDLMSDLRHYCGANGIDFDDCVRISEGHHVEEVAKG